MGETTGALSAAERAFLSFAFTKTELAVCHAARRCPLALLCLPDQPQCTRLGVPAGHPGGPTRLGLAEHLVALYFVQETSWNDCLACPNYALCGSQGFDAPICSGLTARLHGLPHGEERHEAQTQALLERLLPVEDEGGAPLGPVLVFGDVPPDGVDLDFVRQRARHVDVMGSEGVPDPVSELGRQLWGYLDPLLRPDRAGGRGASLSGDLLRALRDFRVDAAALSAPEPIYARVIAPVVNLRLFAGTLVRLADQVVGALGPQRGPTLLGGEAWSQACHAVMGQLEVAVATLASGAVAPNGELFFSQASRYCQYIPRDGDLLGTDVLAFAHPDAQQPQHWAGVTAVVEAQWALGVQPAPIGDGVVVYEIIGGIYRAPA